MHLPFFLFFSSKPNLNSAPINELQSPLFPYIDALYRSPDMILTPFDGKFDEKKDAIPAGTLKELLRNPKEPLRNPKEPLRNPRNP